LPKLPAMALTLATLAFPLALYLAQGHWEPRWLALGLTVLACARAWFTRQMIWWVGAAGAGAMAAASLSLHAWAPLKLYPALVNAVLLAVFATSLARPPSVIERLARLSVPDLPPAGVRYTRRVTQVWCVFFVGNGMVALATALWASTEVWAFYNGFLAYVLMGVLFGAEWLVRRRVQARLTHD
jgi:uncharacterized membrane protein